MAKQKGKFLVSSSNASLAKGQPASIRVKLAENGVTIVKMECKHSKPLQYLRNNPGCEDRTKLMYAMTSQGFSYSDVMDILSEDK